MTAFHEIYSNYRHDGEPRALYWGEYRAAYEQVREVLQPSQLITPEIMGEYGLDMHIGMLHNAALKPEIFDLRKPDQQTIVHEGTNGEIAPYTFTYPGKSAHFDFVRSHSRGPMTKDDLRMVINAVFGRDWRNGDHLHIVSAEKLADIGYFPYWTPLPNHPLHVRIVHQSHFEKPEQLYVKKRARELLAASWFKVK